MRSFKDILKIIRNGLAIYGAACLVTGWASDRMEKSWNRVVSRTEDSIHEFIYGEPKEVIIDGECQEVG